MNILPKGEYSNFCIIRNKLDGIIKKKKKKSFKSIVDRQYLKFLGSCSDDAYTFN